jgi:antitoxin (DNA-binding transcriptional repressor) of toxin-antitoxin stability system
MLVISTREFREKQGIYLHRAKNGEDIILKSRENGSFKLVPVTDNDAVIDRKYILKPDADLSRAITAEEFLQGAKDHIRELYSQKDK